MFLSRVFSRVVVVPARREEGSVLVAVIGVMAMGLIIASIILTSVVNSLSFTSATRAGVQSQASADAGIAMAQAGIFAGTCTTGIYESAPGDVPEYRAEVWREVAGAWEQGCPAASATAIKIVANGGAEALGVAGYSSRDSSTVEAVYQVPVPPTTIAATGAAIYAFSSSGFTGGGHLYSVNGSVPDVHVLSGNVTCNGGSQGINNLIVGDGNLSIVAGCQVTGSAWASDKVTIAGGITVPGSIIANLVELQNGTVNGSVWSATDVITSGWPTVNGAVIATNMTVAGGVFNGPIWLRNHMAISNGEANGHVTAKTLTKKNYMNISSTLSPTPAPGPPTPAVPVVPNWVDFDYVHSDWTGFAQSTISGSCSVTTLRNAVNSFGAGPGVVDARGCTGGIVINGSDKVTISGDVAIIANKFSLTAGGGFAAAGNKRLWLINTDDVENSAPTCAPGASIKIEGDFDFSPGIATMIYTPCAITIASGIDTIRGQVYAGSATIAGGAQIGFVPVGLPGVDLTAGTNTGGAGGGGSTDPELVSVRNISSPAP